MSTPDSTIPLKKCTKCQQEYPATTQYFNKGKKPQSLRAMCRICNRESINPNTKKRLPLLPVTEDGLKICSKCLDTLPATTEYFSQARRYKNGLSSWCRKCQSKQNMKYERQHRHLKKKSPPKTSGKRVNNPGTRTDKTCPKCEHTYPATMEYFLPNERSIHGISSYCRECEKIRSREKQRKIRSNPAKRTELNIRERISNRRRYKSNPAIRNRIKHRNRLRRTLQKSLTLHEWQRCLGYFNHCCAACGRPAGFWHTIALDHWKPIIRGGGTTPDNVIPLCHSIKDGTGGCNNEKRDKPAEEWLIEQFGKRKAAEILDRIHRYFEHIKQQ